MIKNYLKKVIKYEKLLYLKIEELIFKLKNNRFNINI